MRITEINIAEFGCIKNKIISPEAGMNIVYGENESGKSTVLLFIKYMLYGLGRRAASNSERERSISWSGHTAAGSMTFVHDEKVYRIERRYVEGGREKLSVTCLDDGSEISTDKTPGEYFLGVPKEVFESSSFVGQMRSSRIDGEKTVESIRNMLTSADESVDTSKILKNLDSVRVGYLHKNKTGGSLYEDGQRIISCRQRLERARNNAQDLEEQNKRLDKAKNDYETVKKELDEKDALLSEMNKIMILNRFKSLENKKAEHSALSKRKEDLFSQELLTDYFPSRDHLAELRVSARAVSDAEKNVSEQESLICENANNISDGELVRVGERVTQNGGVDRIIDAISTKNRKIKMQSSVIAALWGAQALFSVSAVMLFLSGFLWGAALFAFVVPTIIFTVVCSVNKKNLRREINDIAAVYGATPDMLSQILEQALNAFERHKAEEANRARLDANLKNALNNLDLCRERLATLLLKTLPEADPDCETASSEIARLERFITAYESILREEDTLERLIADEHEALKEYDIDEIGSQISVDVSHITPAAIAEAQRIRGSLVARKATFEQKLITLGNSIAQLKASAEDPLDIADELEEIETRFRSDKEFYESLTLAMESIEQAGQLMSGSVTPAISKRASEIMARISKDKYTVLRTTGSLGVSLDSEGFGIKSELLSEGTRDAAYLALRIALFTRMYGTEMPPLMLDEALCQFDDVRAQRMLLMLAELSGEGIQCLCFTSHKREGEILNSEGVDYCNITL